MSDHDHSTEQRIARLERSNRRMTAAAMALGALWLVAATDRPATITTSAFQLIDQTGQVRAELGFRNGAPGLFILDEQGHDRLLAVHDAEGTGVYLNDPDGTTRVGMAQFTHGGGGIAMHGTEAKGATVLYHKGQGSLTFFDEEGGVIHQVLAEPPAGEAKP